jgi:hypothetical protein
MHGALPQETPHKLLPEEDREGEVEAQSAIHHVDLLSGAWAHCRKKLHTSDTSYYLRRMGKRRLKLAIHCVDHLRSAWGVAARISTIVIT